MPSAGVEETDLERARVRQDLERARVRQVLGDARLPDALEQRRSLEAPPPSRPY
jgi:hypothetical protein